jgi:hypothetical protein
MNQGYSGSALRREGNTVVKISSDADFVQSAPRQRDLMALSAGLPVLPRIHRIDPPAIYMDYVEGREGFAMDNAARAGHALWRLHAQQAYSHVCNTGMDWLLALAGPHLSHFGDRDQAGAALHAEFPLDALIHSEPQFIEKPDGSIVFIDIEGIGMGSRYQDLAHAYFCLVNAGRADVFKPFLEGYQSAGQLVDMSRLKKLAGIIALAYATFAEPQQRVTLGLRLLQEAGQT